MLIEIRPHHILRLHHFLNGVPLVGLTAYEVVLYTRISHDPNVQIQVVEGLDNICKSACREEDKPDKECLGDPSGQERFLAEQYNLEIRKKPYAQSEFFEGIKSSWMWKSVNKMSEYLKKRA